MKRVLITGSSGLIGSEAVTFFDQQGWEVHGIDNNMRGEFFGQDGDTTWNLRRLLEVTRHFTHHHLDIRDRTAMLERVKNSSPDLLIHSQHSPRTTWPRIVRSTILT